MKLSPKILCYFLLSLFGFSQESPEEVFALSPKENLELSVLYQETANPNLPSDKLLYYAWSGYQLARKKQEVRYEKKFLEKIGDAFLVWGYPDSAEKYYSLLRHYELSYEEQSRLLRRTRRVILTKGMKNPDPEFLRRSSELLPKLTDKEEIAEVYLVYAHIYKKQGNLDSTLYYLKKTEELKTENLALQAKIHTVFGTYHFARREFKKAWEKLEQAENLIKKLNHKPVSIIVYKNVGNYFINIKNYDKALDYYLKALELCKELKYRIELVGTLNNIGVAYLLKEDYAKSLEIQREVWKIRKKLGLEGKLSATYLNIGVIYRSLDKQDSALYYFRRALKRYKKDNNEHGRFLAWHNIGRSYLQKKEYFKALEALKKAYEISRKHNFLYGQVKTLKYLAQTYEKLKRPKEALQYYREYLRMQDTLQAKTQEQALIAKELELKFQREKELQEAEFESRQRIGYIILGAISLILLITVVFLILFSKKYAAVKKQREFIEEQQKILIEKNLEIEKQKQAQREALEKLQVKNRKILDSLYAARKIQNALFETVQQIRPQLPAHFLFFHPKEVISGDFYWLRKKDNIVYVAVADCTGKGVPAAFLTILGITFLDKILDSGTEEPAEILNQLRELIVQTLNLENKLTQKEGMEIALIKLNLENQNLQYAGAYSSLYVLTKNKESLTNLRENAASYLRQYPSGNKVLCEILPDKQLVGAGLRSPHPFTNHSFCLHPADEIVLTTDGFVNQFGGERGKKFGYRWFKELLLRIYELPVSEQEKMMEKVFFDWMGNQEQLDDVLVFGMKCSDFAQYHK